MTGPCVGYLLTGNLCRRPGVEIDEEAGGLLCAECATAARERRAATGSGRADDLVGAMMIRWGVYGDGTGGSPDFIDRAHTTWLPRGADEGGRALAADEGAA